MSCKRHLEIELIEFAGRAVRTRVLIAEAGRNLEIFIEAGGHQQLLELLRCLRQRIELALMLAGGNDIIARALRRRAGEDRRGDLRKAELLHFAAQKADDLGSKEDIIVHPLITQIEKAVFQAHLLARFGGFLHVERQIWHTRAEHLQRIRHDLQTARRDFRIDCFFIAGYHLARDRDDRFTVQVLEQCVVVHNHLRHTVLVT